MIAQLFIALFGVTAVALSQSTFASRRRWASIFGLVGQPFWFYAAWDTQQWGIFALCILYTITWGKGFYSNWIAARAAPQAQPADALDAETIKKAARYDWLSEQGTLRDDCRHLQAWRVFSMLSNLGGERADAAIDAAMAAAQEGGNAAKEA